MLQILIFMVIVYKVVAEGFFILFLLIQCEGFLLVEQKNKNKKSLFQLTTSNWFFHKYGGSLVTFFTTLIKTRAILYSLNQTVDNGNNVCQSGNVIIIIDLVTIASEPNDLCVILFTFVKRHLRDQYRVSLTLLDHPISSAHFLCW